MENPVVFDSRAVYMAQCCPKRYKNKALCRLIVNFSFLLKID